VPADRRHARARTPVHLSTAKPLSRSAPPTPSGRIVGVCAAIVMLLVSFVGGGCGESASESSLTSAPSRASLAPEYPKLKAAFKPLRSAPEALPGWMQQQILKYFKELDPSKAQQVGSTAGRYWLVPGRDEGCLFEVRKRGRPVATCTPVAFAFVHGLSIVSIRPLGKLGRGPYKRRVFGLVPDWVKRVSVRTGSSVAKPLVHHGIYNMSDWNYNPPDTIVMRPLRAIPPP
jgi:hypothetical protein